MQNIADKLSITLNAKQSIKAALTTAGIDMTGVTFNNYASKIASVGQLPVGTIADYKTNQNAPGWLLCNGSQVSQAAYPELYAAIGGQFNTGAEAPGFFRLPDLPNVTHGNISIAHMIKAEIV